MCSAPKAPKAPKIEKPYEFQAFENDPEFMAMAKRMGIGKGKLSSSKVSRVKANMQAEEFYLRYTNNPAFAAAADQLKEEGRINWEFKQDQEGGFWRTHRNQVSSWQFNEVIDLMNQTENREFQEEQDASYREWSEETQLQFQEMQQEFMESMQQPTQRQAPMPTVQAPQAEFKPQPQAPPNPLMENLPQAPPPQLADTSQVGGTIRTQQSASQRRASGNRGTGSLKIPKKKSRSSAPSSNSIGLSIPK